MTDVTGWLTINGTVMSGGGFPAKFDPFTDKIQRVNLDGSNVEDIVTQGLVSPEGIILDVTGGKEYISIHSPPETLLQRVRC